MKSGITLDTNITIEEPITREQRAVLTLWTALNVAEKAIVFKHITQCLTNGGHDEDFDSPLDAPCCPFWKKTTKGQHTTIEHNKRQHGKLRQAIRRILYKSAS